MIILKSMTDLNQLNPSDPAYAVVKRHLQRMAYLYPETGYLVLVEQADMGKPVVLPELTADLASICWEGTKKLNDSWWWAGYLTSNEFWLEFLLAEDGLEEKVRKNLVANLS